MIYDGDGNRVKATIGGVTTVYIGNYAVPGDPSGDPNPGYFAYPRDFKWNETSGTLTKYYYAGGDRVAMTTGSNTRYLLRDHPTLSLWTCLGSTTVSVAGVGSDPSPTLGTGLSELRYTAWGETRYADGTTPTKRHYTGQIEENTLGLYWYGSRWYDGALGRFAQPDSIIPDMRNTLDWDRYSYARNNPVQYNDPTGHFANPGSHVDAGGKICRDCVPDLFEWANKTINFRFDEEVKGDSVIDQWLIENVDPFRRLAAFTWALNRVTDFRSSSTELKIAAHDVAIIAGSNLETGLFALSMGGDLAPVVGSGNAYSVAYETTLPQSVYRYARSSHNYRANKALLADMNADPHFAQAMNELISNLSQELYYRPNASPQGWTWHHVADQPGVMQLIPRIQHEFPLLQYLLHPGGKGGFSLWP